jgi:diguanylate cyclase (GGDEF)-like protein
MLHAQPGVKDHTPWSGLCRLCLFWLMLLVAMPSRADAAGIPLRAGWLPAAAADNASEVATGRARLPLQAFDASQLASFPRQRDGFWVRLDPADGGWPQEPLVLALHLPPFVSVAMVGPDGSAFGRKAVNDLAPSAWYGHGRLAFPIPDPSPPGGAIVLRVTPAHPLWAPVGFTVQTLADYQRRDAQWLSFASACFTTMLVMAVIALFFAVRLGDRAFYYYSGYIVSYALLQGLQSGYVFHPLEFGFLNHSSLAWYRLAVGGSVVLPALFLDAFANLRYYFPLAHRSVLGFGFAAAITTLIGFLPWPLATVISHYLFNPVLVLGLLNMLVSTIIAFSRGSRYAGFFLLGWTPLLVVAGLASAQLYGQLASWAWVDDARIAVGAYEAIVLSLGLIDRTLMVRRERDLARRMAELDPLTSLLNRRAWQSQVQGLLERAQQAGHSLTVLFVDLDYFKSLNDHFGHAAGDEALLRTADMLRGSLRPGDPVSRYGGEEFVAAQPQCNAEGAHHIAERVLASIAALALPVNREGDRLTASIGIAMAAQDERMDTLLARADRAMYEAKVRGRNQIVVADESPPAQ